MLAAVAALLRSVLRGRAVTLPYERIERLFTPAERSFLGVLEQIFGSDYRILGNLRLADIIRTRKGLPAVNARQPSIASLESTWTLLFVSSVPFRSLVWSSWMILVMAVQYGSVAMNF